jgi:hypothetical protein
LKCSFIFFASNGANHLFAMADVPPTNLEVDMFEELRTINKELL